MNKKELKDGTLIYYDAKGKNTKIINVKLIQSNRILTIE